MSLYQGCFGVLRSAMFAMAIAGVRPANRSRSPRASANIAAAG
jgi:hypothetical protein